MRVGQVAIQRQRLFAFSDASVRAVRKNLDVTHMHVGLRVVGVHGQNLNQGRLGRREARGPVTGRKVSPPY